MDDDNAPLTKKFFLEFFAKYDEKIDARFEKIDNRLEKLEKDMKEVKHYIHRDAMVIEYELDAILKKHLESKYPRMILEVFPMKRMYDIYTDKEITELDSAFILKPYLKKPDLSRVKEAGLSYPSKLPPFSEPSTFVLAEAKHHITKDKVSTKLKQLDLMIQIFIAAKQIQDGTANLEKLSKKFITTVERNPYLGEITQWKLFFGGPYSEPGLLQALEADVKKRKGLGFQFRKAEGEKKINLYKQIIELENKWYKTQNLPLSDEEILPLTQVNSLLEDIEFILPSGNRYKVKKESEDPFGIAQFSLEGGKRKTKKNKDL